MLAEVIAGPDPEEPQWHGGYTCHQLPCGEYVRSGAQWKFERMVAESVDTTTRWDRLIGNYRPKMRVMAKMRIVGKSMFVKDDEWGRQRYRPRRWGMSLEVGRHTMNVVSGVRCTSLKDAMRQADVWLANPFEGFETPLAAFLKQVYSPGWLTACVYRLKDSAPRYKPDRWSRQEVLDEVLLDPSNWEPCYTDLKIGGEFGPREWGVGYFLEVRSESRWIRSIRQSVRVQYAWLVRRDDMCTSGRGGLKYTELARLLGGMWTPGAPDLRPPTKPVTDPDIDAPDGAVVDGYERQGDTWVRIDE